MTFPLLTEAEQIRLVRSESKIDHEFTVIWVPRRTLVSNLILEEHGVLGEANITELDLHFVPLEPDLLSLELDDSFSELYLRKDPTSIFASAKALMLLQKKYGLFPKILGKGDSARRLADLLVKMREEEEVSASADPSSTYPQTFGLTPSGLIENLIIVDREVDFPTTLATQLTYEGLLDETFGISNSQTEVDSSILGVSPAQPTPQNGSAPAPTAATKRKLQLDSSDKLYPTLRDVNFATIGTTLNRTARRLQSDQQNIHKADQSISDLKSFVSRLPTYQAEQASLKIHTSLAEEVMKTTRSDLFRRTLEIEQNLLAGSDPGAMHDSLDELIAREVPLRTILRLLCLESTLNNGLRPRDLEAYKRAVLSAYGFQHILTLRNLEKMGLLVARESHRGYLNPIAGSAGQTATDWNAVRKTLHLWVDDVQETEPDDIAYVFSGYAPLSVRLVQCVLQKQFLQTFPPGAAATSSSIAKSALSLTPAAATATPAAPASTPAANPTSTGWKPFEDTLSRIRGATVDITQSGRDAAASQARKTLRANREGPKISLVFFLGGVTFAEIAALRFVGGKLGEGRGVVIATTGIVGGRRGVDAAVETRRFGG